MEEIKELHEIDKPDERVALWAYVDLETGETRRFTLEDHYNRVNSHRLHDKVPSNIRSHFATALNLFLYTWYAYDFTPVAEQRVLTTLELALKERIGNDELEKFSHRKKGLKGYIRYAVKKGWIKNDDFSAYHRLPFERAKQEYVSKKLYEMNERGLDSIDVDYNEVVVPENNNIDYLKILEDSVNKIRNIYAHGSNMIHPSIGYSFEMVTDFINSLYSQGSDGCAQHDSLL